MATRLQDLRYRPRNISATTNLDFDHNLLKVLLAIDESKTLLQVAREVDLDRKTFKQCLIKLFNYKLIEKVNGEVEYLPERLLEYIRSILISLLGPLGVALMEDVAESMGMDSNAIPKGLLDDYLAELTENIPEEKQQRLFQDAVSKLSEDP